MKRFIISAVLLVLVLYAQCWLKHNVTEQESQWNLQFLGEQFNQQEFQTTFNYQLTIGQYSVNKVVVNICPDFDRNALVQYQLDQFSVNVVNTTQSLQFTFQAQGPNANSVHSLTVVLTGNVSTVEDVYLVENQTATLYGNIQVPECIQTVQVEQTQPHQPQPSEVQVPSPPQQSQLPNCNQCSATDGCCALSTGGSQCFDPNLYDCVSGMLCPKNYLACGNQCYSTQDYTCFNGTFLCPVNTQRCGDACYSTSLYVCLEGNFLCPATHPNKCGIACYASDQYGCDNGVLVQLL